MNWKETIIGWEKEYEKAGCMENLDVDKLLQDQAKISFKAAIRAVVEKLEAWRAQGTHLISDEAIKAIKEWGRTDVV